MDSILSFQYTYFAGGWLTVGVTGTGAGMDSAWEQEKPEARKTLEKTARAKRSPTRQVHALLAHVSLFTFSIK
jgi:hypothetical protein